MKKFSNIVLMLSILILALAFGLMIGYFQKNSTPPELVGLSQDGQMFSITKLTTQSPEQVNQILTDYKNEMNIYDK